MALGMPQTTVPVEEDEMKKKMAAIAASKQGGTQTPDFNPGGGTDVPSTGGVMTKPSQSGPILQATPGGKPKEGAPGAPPPPTAPQEDPRLQAAKDKFMQQWSQNKGGMLRKPEAPPTMQAVTYPAPMAGGIGQNPDIGKLTTMPGRPWLGGGAIVRGGGSGPFRDPNKPMPAQGGVQIGGGQVFGGGPSGRGGMEDVAAGGDPMERGPRMGGKPAQPPQGGPMAPPEGMERRPRGGMRPQQPQGPQMWGGQPTRGQQRQLNRQTRGMQDQISGAQLMQPQTGGGYQMPPMGQGGPEEDVYRNLMNGQGQFQPY